MPAMAMVLIGFGAGLFTMAVISLYKWVVHLLQSDAR